MQEINKKHTIVGRKILIGLLDKFLSRLLMILSSFFLMDDIILTFKVFMMNIH